jgi:hypothetical protein
VSRSRRFVAALGLILIVAAAGVIALTTHGTTKNPAAPAVIHPQTTSSAPTPQTAVFTRAARTPFVLAGARFSVFVNNNEAWASFAKTASAGRGKRWEIVTVDVTNLTRSGFDPRVLHYRLMGRDVNYFADLAYGTAADASKPPRPLARGALVQVKLAFRVPDAAAGLQLAFDPTGHPARLLVTLGH